jgi:sugar O-acyltransferase (sialic acid O-acetyltransferase NeuD family)
MLLTQARWNLLMEKTNFILVGASGHARVVMSVIEAQGHRVVGIFDKNTSILSLDGVTNEGDYNADMHQGAKAIVAIGDNKIRKRISKNLMHQLGNAVHPSVQLDRLVTLGKGNVIMHQAVVQRGCQIGAHCIINTKATVDHDCRIDDYVHIGPGATLCGGVSVGEGSLIGVGASVLPGITIGKNVTVGAGAIVLNDIPDNARVIGVPGKQVSE